MPTPRVQVPCVLQAPSHEMGSLVAQLNQNFRYLSNVLGGTSSQVPGVATNGILGLSGLQGSVSSLQASVTALQSSTAALQSSTAALQGSVGALQSAVAGIAAVVITKAPLNSPVFTGTVTIPTPTVGDNSTKAASTAFVQTAVAGANPMTALGDLTYGGVSGAETRLAGDTTNTRKFLREQSSAGVAAAPAWDVLQAGDIPAIAESQVTNLTSDLAARAPLAAPVFTGRVSADSFGTGNSVAATTLGTVQAKVEVFDKAGVSLGFMPLYDAIT